MTFLRKSKYLIFILTVILFFIPFFWFTPGEVDLGGDSSRLYFYDPENFFLNDGLYFFEFVLDANRAFSPHFFILPYVSILLIAEKLIHSPYFWISVANGIKVSLSFFSVAMIIRTLLKKFQKGDNEKVLQAASILGGLSYLCAPIIIGNYDKALITQDQVFLNPLMFYFLLAYFLTQQFRYLSIILIITIIFSPNFSFIAAPPIFSFYPFAVAFILFYILFIKKKRVLFRHLLIFLILFLGLHAFHFIPEFISLFNHGSGYSERVFNGSDIANSINYFMGVLPSSHLSYNFFSYLPIKQYAWLGFFPMLIIILAFIFNKKKNYLYLFTGILYLISLYFFTANITHLGVIFYQHLFYIPGFSMFRNFVGWWAFVNAFFYALLFGQAIFILYKKISKRNLIIFITILLSIAQIVGAWNFFTGKMVNSIHPESNNVKIPQIVDPAYEETLAFIRTLPNDGAFASFPFTDCCYTVVHGLNSGAYVGPSPIRELTGFRDYNGYGNIVPFSEVILPLVKNKNYREIKGIFGLLNTRYIYYNDNQNIYDTVFSGYPYSSMRAAFPQTQKQYKLFIKNIAGEEIYHNGSYFIYKTQDAYFNPVFYAASTIDPYKNTKNDWYGKSASFSINNYDAKTAYIEQDVCKTIFSIKECESLTKKMPSIPEISFKKVNPVMFHVSIKNATQPYLLVFSQTFHDGWNISVTKNNVYEDLDFFNKNNLVERHILVNGWANAWYILPSDVGNKSDYTLTIQLNDQKIFYVSLIISLLTLMIVLIYLIYTYIKNKKFSL